MGGESKPSKEDPLPSFPAPPHTAETCRRTAVTMTHCRASEGEDEGGRGRTTETEQPRVRERGEVFIPTVAANARRRRRESSPEHYTSIPRPRRADRITPLCTDNDFTIPSHTGARISRGICGIKPEFSPGFTPKKKVEQR